jgi:hypothetical protein
LWLMGSYLLWVVVRAAFWHLLGAVGLGPDHYGFCTEPYGHWQDKHHTRWLDRPADKSADYVYKARLRGLCMGGRDGGYSVHVHKALYVLAPLGSWEDDDQSLWQGHQRYPVPGSFEF